ncbi:hypothetical protein ACF0H5_017199 [Mactra antiquata]
MELRVFLLHAVIVSVCYSAGIPMGGRIQYGIETESGETTNIDAVIVDTPQDTLSMTSSTGGQTVINLLATATFYDETNGDVFVLRAEEQTDGKLKSKLFGKFHRNGQTCIVSEQKSSCKREDRDEVNREMFESIQVPDSDTDSTTTSRSRRNIETIDDYNTTNIVQVIYLVDGMFMQVFRDRNANEDDARAEAGVYLHCLTVELTMWYRSLATISKADPLISDYELVFYVKGIHYSESKLIFHYVGWEVTKQGCQQNRVCDGLTSMREFVADNTLFPYEDWDNVIGLFGRDLYSATSGYSLLGIAYVGTVCRYSEVFGVLITEFGPFSVGWVLSHEMGHAFGAGHDGTNSCPTGTYIMSGSLVSVTSVNRPTIRTFSTCSVSEIAVHLDTYGPCLATYEVGVPAAFVEMMCNGPRGQNFDIDFQCNRLLYGSTACSSDVIIREDGAKMVSEEACWNDFIVGCTFAGSSTCSGLSIHFVTDGTPFATGETVMTKEVFVHRPLVQAHRLLAQAHRPLVQVHRLLAQAHRLLARAHRPLARAQRPLARAQRPLAQRQHHHA